MLKETITGIEFDLHLGNMYISISQEFTVPKFNGVNKQDLSKGNQYKCSNGSKILDWLLDGSPPLGGEGGTSN